MYSTEVKRKGSLRENLLLNRFSSLQEIPKMGGWEGKGTFKKHNEKEKLKKNCAKVEVKKKSKGPARD